MNLNRLSLFAASAALSVASTTAAIAAVTGPAEVDGLPPYQDPAEETVTVDVNFYVPAYLQDGKNASHLIPDMIAFGLRSIDYANMVFHQNGAGVKFAVRDVEYVDWMGDGTGMPSVKQAWGAMLTAREGASADVMVALSGNDKTRYGQALVGTQSSPSATLGVDVGITSIATFHESSIGYDGDYAILAPKTLAHELSHVLGNAHEKNIGGYWPNSRAAKCLNGMFSLTAGMGIWDPILTGTVGCGNDPTDADELGTILETRHLLASTYEHEIDDDVDAGLSLAVVIEPETNVATVTVSRTNNIESELAASVAIYSADWGTPAGCSSYSGMEYAALAARSCSNYYPLPAGTPSELTLTLAPGAATLSVDVDMSAVPVDLVEELKTYKVDRDVGFVVTNAQGHAMPQPVAAKLVWDVKAEEPEQPQEPAQPQEPTQPGDSGGGGSMSWLALLALCLPLAARRINARKQR